MNPADIVAQTAQPVLVFGRGWMAHPDTAARGQGLGLEPPFGFWIVGRAGFLGDAPADVAAAAIGFMHRDRVAAAWDECPDDLSKPDVTRAYAACATEWGREVLAGIDSTRLTRLDHLGRKVTSAASPSLGALFAGWRSAVEAPGDPGGNATLTLNVLRELRAGAHLIAVQAIGIGPHGAIMASEPPRGGERWAETFGWPTPHPAPQPDKRAEAEALTSALLVPAYGALEESEQAELIDLVTEAVAAAE
ncbi:MAG: hypothetical protein GY745_07235 [Actinomycetia bacterium]|nr:hypothetical protein [Actinomycetes bacterium]MCP3909993.1 hypothetical protein [Actinomycetes bacterium]MCP4084831.1 hypothetical protein [Actinomycetes bacterium]